LKRISGFLIVDDLFNIALVQWMLQCFLSMFLRCCASLDLNLLEVLKPETNDTTYYAVSTSGDTIVVGDLLEDNSTGAVYVFVRDGITCTQQAHLKASNAEESNLFGCAVSISGDTIVAGAWRESSNATGVNGDQSNNDIVEAGAAYVFVRNGTSWNQQAYLKASNPGPFDRFGIEVSISEDTIVVTSWYEDSNATGVNGDQSNNDLTNTGAAHVFVRDGTTWAQQSQ
jgi:hypothetical protein